MQTARLREQLALFSILHAKHEHFVVELRSSCEFGQLLENGQSALYPTIGFPWFGFRRCHGAVPILSNFSGAIFRQSG
jgi:hypothetical protein